MQTFLVRLATVVLTIFSAMVLLFVLTTLVPGDPATALLGPEASPAAARQFVAEMGLDKPVLTRLGIFAGRLLMGDLGTDVLSDRPVLGVVAAAVPPTLALTAAGMALAIVFSIPLGVIAALRPGSVLDHGLAGLSVAMIAVPSFVVAIALLLVFSVWLDWLPVLGAGSGGLGDQARRLVLPAVALSIGWVGFLARLVRTSMLEVLGQPYIRTARAFGLRRRQVVFKYALKNALVPALSVLGLGVGRLLGGAVLVEIVFARPGLGRLMLDAINARNFPVLQGAVLVVVTLFVVANQLTDMALAAIDPRTRQ